MLKGSVVERNSKQFIPADPIAVTPQPAWLFAPRIDPRLAKRDAKHQRMRNVIGWGALALVCVTMLGPAHAQDTMHFPETAGSQSLENFITAGPDQWKSREGLNSAIQVMLLLTVLSLAPAVLLMTTSFVRIIVVLGLLRQALGVQQLPPSQVLTSIAMFMTVLLMTPVWTDVYNDAIQPYTAANSDMSIDEAWAAGVRPVRRFMSRQIDIAGNGDDVMMFYEYANQSGPRPTDYDDVPLQVLLPAFMLSELKVAFLIGFQIYLPFLILDVVIASVTISMGMMMLPPVMISLPFKLMLFVLVDGWRLVIGMLMESFAPYT